MAAEIRRQTVGDYFTLQRGTTYKSRLLGQPGPVLLGLATIERNGGFRTDSLRTYGGDSPDNLIVQPGELYLSLKDVTQSADLLGAVARLPRDHLAGRLTQDTVRLQPKDPSVPLDYLYWLLRTPQYRRYCRAHATGTTNLGLAREDFLAFPAPEPTSVQLRIVGTLNALDDKIELNRRMNETLEAIARAIFKSWFVNFDPVRAKMDGRWRRGQSPPGLPADLYDLFPDSFEDSPLGKIPRGWSATQLSDAFEINPPRLLSPSAVSPYLDMANMPTNSPRPLGWVDRAFTSGMKFINGDTLFARITPCLENGKTAFVDFLEDGQVGWGSTEYIVLRSKPPLPLAFSYFLARSDNFRAHAIANMSGTSGRQRVPVSCFDGYLVVVPPAPIAESFDRLAQPMMTAIKQHDEESRTLAEMRDGLLPKLISGEIRITIAEDRVASQL
jgi:type I restriction enzyme S subunit